MKQIFLTIASLFFLISAFGNQKPDANQISINKAVTKNTTIQTSANKNDELLTKAEFILKVWDFTKSPNDWKYLGIMPAIIDFYADWCGPCKIASPILEEIGSEYKGKILVYKINTDQKRELAKVFNITGIPAFLYIPVKGKPTMMAGIGKSKEETKKMFIDNIEKYMLVKK